MPCMYLHLLPPVPRSSYQWGMICNCHYPCVPDTSPRGTCAVHAFRHRTRPPDTPCMLRASPSSLRTCRSHLGRFCRGRGDYHHLLPGSPNARLRPCTSCHVHMAYIPLCQQRFETYPGDSRAPSRPPGTTCQWDIQGMQDVTHYLFCLQTTLRGM